jgi:SanA protein
MKLLSKTFKIFSIFVLLFAALLFITNYWVVSIGSEFAFNQLDKLGNRDIALVLGTSRSVNGINENPFFSERMRAAASLYHSGRVKHILVSGDNSNKEYNEPRDMRAKLIQLGVPADAITMDFAGRRTLDSVIRCKEIFQQKKVIIVSQEFHNYRALFIARHEGLDAVGYNAYYPKDVSYRILFREYFARPKAVLDLYFLNTRPKIMGKKVDIPV